jgi:hypothetical protein
MKMAGWHGVEDWGVEHRLGQGERGRQQIDNYSLMVWLIIDTSHVPYIGVLTWPLSNNLKDTDPNSSSNIISFLFK